MIELLDRPSVEVETVELQEWLEWAGARLLALGTKSPFPQGYKSNMPEPVPGRWDYVMSERLRPPRPHSKEIQLMDEILLLPGLIKEQLPRQIVNARALVTPLSDRYLYSWTKLAHMLHTDRRKVMRLHHRGLVLIAQSLNREKAYAIRKTMVTLAT